MIIKGLEKTSLVDYPGKMACTVFLPFCDFRCPFCHNPDLINNPDLIPDLSLSDFFSFLESRKGWLDGVCITGGEPCLSDGLLDFIKEIRSRGFLVKLDTNGSLPDVLRSVINHVNYVAMDIKACPSRYSEASGVKVDLDKINESIKLIRESGVDYEFRSTIMPRLHSRDDLLSIGKWLSGSKSFVIQQFRPDMGVLSPDFARESPFSVKELNDFALMLKPFFNKVIVRD